MIEALTIFVRLCYINIDVRGKSGGLIPSRNRPTQNLR